MFDSSILMEKTSVDTLSISKLSTNEFKSYLHQMLEFNDTLHDIDVDYQIKEYRALKEMAETSDPEVIQALEEGVISENAQKISDAIAAIIRFLKDFAMYLTNSDIRERNQYRKMSSRTSLFRITNRANESMMFTQHNYPSIIGMDTTGFNQCLNGIVGDIERICSGANVTGISDASMAEAFKKLANSVKNDRTGRSQYSGAISSAADFREFVKGDLIYITRSQMTYEEWRKSIEKLNLASRSDINKKTDGMVHELERCQKMVRKANIVDKQTKADADTLVRQLKTIVDAFTWFIKECYAAESAQIRYIMKTYTKLSSTANEFGFIHGEEFNSDTLFDNEDMRDFNRTEWMDLTLATECYELKYEFGEVRRRIALQEAIILSDDQNDKFARLVAMREAEGAKLGDKFMEIIQRLKGFLEQFLSALKDKFSVTTRMIKDNPEIMSKPFGFTDVTSSGDVLAGLYRLQKNTNYAPYNPEAMKDDLSDKKVFFAKHVLGSLNESSTFSKRDVKWNDEMNITDYCKAYFGASMPDMDPCKFTNDELNRNKENIVKLLNGSNIFINTIKADLSKLEAEAKKVANNVAKPAAPAANDAAKGDEAQQESMYYSELYGTWFTEAEINVDETKAKEGEEGEKKSGGSDPFKVYMECYRDVFTSKLTAAQFVISELTQVVTRHISMNGGKVPNSKKENKAEVTKPGDAAKK